VSSAPAFGTRRTRVHVLGSEARDLAFAHRTMIDPANAGPFRWRGATPSPAEVADLLSDGVLCTFVVSGRSSGRPAGLVIVASPDLRDGHAFLSVVAARERHGSGLVVEGAVAAVEHAFRQWPFRKLYADVDNRSLPAIRSWLERLCTHEGRFGEHTYRGGERLDVHRFALYRPTWEDEMERLGPRLAVQVP
jgi:RimJ/RimL family protein N-acetyltransferase